MTLQAVQTEELDDNQKRVLAKAKKEYDIKFKTWSIDRAIEIGKLSGSNVTDAEGVLKFAEQLCAYVCSSPKTFQVPTPEDAENAVIQAEAQGEEI